MKNTMNLDIKTLSTQSEFDDCIELQNKIWGLEGIGQTSPITLKALSIENPAVGLVLGVYDREKMIGMAIVLATLEAGVAYGHMLGVLDSYRDHKVGNTLHKTLVKELRKHGIREMAWTFEPLESRNAHLYINRMGGHVVGYQTDCFQVDCSMHDGLPLDRMLMRTNIEHPPTQYTPLPLVEVLKKYPLATPDHMPVAESVLVEIPGDLESLKEQDMERAKRFRAETRTVFSEYLNQRGFVAKNFFSGETSKGRQSFYLFSQGADS